MSAISGLMVGLQIFQQADGPFYEKGVIIMIAMVAFGFVAAGVQMGVYRNFNRDLLKRGTIPQRNAIEQHEISTHNEGRDALHGNSAPGAGGEVAVRRKFKRTVPYVL